MGGVGRICLTGHDATTTASSSRSSGAMRRFNVGGLEKRLQVARLWCGSLGVARFSGSLASAGRYEKINRYAMAIRASPPRLQSTLFYYMNIFVAV
jgi:hypothetical protein